MYLHLYTEHWYKTYSSYKRALGGESRDPLRGPFIGVISRGGTGDAHQRGVEDWP